MSFWTIQASEPPAIVTASIPPTSDALSKSFSIPSNRTIPLSVIEQNGLHATLILRIASDGSFHTSSVIFPTSIVSPSNPRGYLSAPIFLPTASQGLRNIAYDGATVSYSTQSHTRVSLFVSPSEPTVWTVLTFAGEQVARDVVGVHNRSLIHDENMRLWKDEFWSSTTQLEIAYSKVAEEKLNESQIDLAERNRLVQLWTRPITLTCPVTEICILNHFAKIRTQESVYDAPNLGLVHSPGGGMFYSGVWCNDEAEYAAPVLAMLGGPGSQARRVALNSLLALSRWFDVEEGSVPYSVEIDGGYAGRLDRGDAGMYAWGASLTMVTMADPHATALLFPHIKFTCEVILAKMESNSHGIVPSQSDELEGRFPTGSANFSVNCICILALEAAAEAAVEAGEPKLSELYAKNAIRLREQVDDYFSVSGPQVYTYFKGCENARGWACLAALARLPRGKDALQYVLSEMWDGDGILTTSDAKDVWDRCTLYGIRAAFQAGMVELAAERFTTFATKRTTHAPAAPFAVENNSSYAQLSAESALVIRVLTEGLLGIRVKHGSSFVIKPQCPAAWMSYSVNSVFIATERLDFKVTTSDETEVVDLIIFVKCGNRTSDQRIPAGAECLVQLKADPLLTPLQQTASIAKKLLSDL